MDQELVFRIDRIRLKNFRCFEDQTIELNPSFNIFLGDNGTGKSSVLAAIGSAVGAWFQGFPRVEGLEKSPISKDDVKFHLVRQKNEYYMSYSSKTQIESDAFLLGKKMHWLRELGDVGKKNMRIGMKEINDFTSAIYENKKNNLDTVLPVIAYYKTGRIFPPKRASNKGGSKIPGLLSGYQCWSTPDTRLDWIVARWQRLQRIYVQANAMGQELPTHYLAAKEAVLQLIPTALNIHYSENLETLVLELEEGPCPITSLSDGFCVMFCLASDIALRAATLNPNLEGDHYLENQLNKTPKNKCCISPGIILIDEIDLHLHPTWQRRIVNDLRTAFPNMQFIATTHAPQVLAGALNDVKIHVLNKENQQVSVTTGEIRAGADADEVLTSNIFNLSSTRDVETLEMWAEHQELLMKKDLTAAEENEKASLRIKLNERLEGYMSFELERLAQNTVAQFLKETVDLDSLEVRKRIREKILKMLRERNNG